ncbi:hypothetical protein MOO44_01240 (plasmid) [Nicoliella spurrieriana]|uniref:Uncharacterized protein n=1 Tax=Nicoliella spurrieriana TaxID=2925830 RepID=A0A976RQV5_9LACO|nr:hypothetical protein [Nicoliella spurrieriana]UQS85971.1 hypothetical protein MOO44_01240 [Nicoliella spurrieriana]
MQKQLFKIIMNGLIYVLIFAVIIIAPLLFLHFIYPNESSPDVWIGFIGSYLGSIVAVIGTVVVTRIQIRTERLDSLNNSLFIENYQMLNSLLNDLYHIKNVSLDYARNINVIKRYLGNNQTIDGISEFVQSFINGFDVQQFASFYNFAKNRLASLNLTADEIDNVDQIITNLFSSNRNLSTDYRIFNQLVNQDAKSDDDIQKMNDNLVKLTNDLSDIKTFLNQLDQSIQDILKDSHDSIAYK